MTPLLQDALEVLGTLEVDEVADRILAAAARATRARGAALWVADGDGELRLHGRHGTVGRDAVAFPLLAGAETLGLLHVQPPEAGFGPDARAAASTLARVAAVALANAVRFEGVRAQTLRDDTSGAYRLAYLADHAGKELDKARRYGRSLSVAVVGLDEDDMPVPAAAPGGAPELQRALVAAVSRAVRDADVVAHAGDGEFQVLLPETDRFGALIFVRRAGEELRRDPALRRLLGRAPRIALGAATFPADGASLAQLVATCRERRSEYRTSLLHDLPDGGGALSFWELVDLLRGELPLRAGGASSRTAAAPALVAALQREVAREIGRSARSRGVAYVAAPSDGTAAPLLAALPHLEDSARAGDVAARVHLLGPSGEPPAGRHLLVSRVAVEGDGRLERQPFLLFLSHDAAYAALWGEDGPLFHSCDVPLVDLLVARLQRQYDLRPEVA